MGKPVAFKAKDVRLGNRLAEKHTLAELTEMMTSAAKGENTMHIAWAIRVKQIEQRAAAGNPVPTDGYSGRISKKRR